MLPEWFDEEWELGLIVGPAVCVTHRRFIPCRKNDGCVISTEQKDIDDVRAYQNSE
jgi:hypothetical protein